MKQPREKKKKKSGTGVSCSAWQGVPRTEAILIFGSISVSRAVGHQTYPLEHISSSLPGEAPQTLLVSLSFFICKMRGRGSMNFEVPFKNCVTHT